MGQMESDGQTAGDRRSNRGTSQAAMVAPRSSGYRSRTAPDVPATPPGCPASERHATFSARGEHPAGARVSELGFVWLSVTP
jgi:hypothetical protein